MKKQYHTRTVANDASLQVNGQTISIRLISFSSTYLLLATPNTFNLTSANVNKHEHHTEMSASPGTASMPGSVFHPFELLPRTSLLQLPTPSYRASNSIKS